jgi:hypothetical protein
VIRSTFIFCAALALAACGGTGPVDKNASNTAGLPDINAAAPTATGEPHVKTAPATAAPARAPSVKIPAALQGRWGLTPADCTTSLGDAKGLLVINSDELRFYESRAVPSADVAADASSISGTFAFTGEGQQWNKYEALKVDKKALVRTEMNPTASFTYAKCS